MSDTHIYFKYKHNEDSEVVSSELVIDRGVLRGFLQQYGEQSELSKRISSFCLIQYSDARCKKAIESFVSYWNSDECGFRWQYEERGKHWHELMKIVIIEEICIMIM